MRHVLLTLMMALMLCAPAIGCSSDSADNAGAQKSDTKKSTKDKKSDAKKDKKDKKSDSAKDSKDKKSDAKKDKKDTPKSDTTKKDPEKDPKTDVKKDAPKTAPASTTASKTEGKPFEGPPSKAIVGQWNISLNKDKLPKGIQNFEELEKMARGTMKFDGKIAVVNIAGQADAIPYNILSDEKNILVLSLAGSRKAKFRITFLDHNNIALKDDMRDGELLGTRAP